MNINLKFYKDQSHFCGDICKTILSFKNHQFSIYFAYFASFVLPKSSKIDNFLRLMEFFENWKSKCHNLMEKSTPVLGYRLLPSLSNKQFKNYSFLRSPCILNCLEAHHQTIIHNIHQNMFQVCVSLTIDCQQKIKHNRSHQSWRSCKLHRYEYQQY